MFTTFMAALDGFTGRAESVALARVLARPRGGHVLIVHVAGPQSVLDGLAGPGLVDAIDDASARALAQARALVGPGDPSPRVVTASSPAAGLRRVAAQERPALIALGPSNRGPLERAMLGTTAQRLLADVPCPIAVAPAGYEGGAIDVVGVAFDGSPQARAAATFAGDLAWHLGASVRIVTALGRRGEVAGRDVARAGARRVQAGVPVEIELQHGDAQEGIARACDAGLDLLVCGSRGRGPLRSALAGGVSAALLKRTPCPVVVLPSRQEARVPQESASPRMEIVADYGAA
jgi:nucleotide-binding universal stress UspA family protein